MPEKLQQYGSMSEIEEDAFLLAELNYRDTHVLHPFGALKQWFEFVAECRKREMTPQEVNERSWVAQYQADTFDFDKELTNAE